jgi:hypothetical protein
MKIEIFILNTLVINDVKQKKVKTIIQMKLVMYMKMVTLIHLSLVEQLKKKKMGRLKDNNQTI